MESQGVEFAEQLMDQAVTLGALMHLGGRFDALLKGGQSVLKIADAVILPDEFVHLTEVVIMGQRRLAGVVFPLGVAVWHGVSLCQ